MRSFKFAPVAWATTILVALTALLAANEAVHVIPQSVMPYLLVAEAVLTAVLGKLAHARVTPVADPRNDAGERLVPKPIGSDRPFL